MYNLSCTFKWSTLWFCKNTNRWKQSFQDWLLITAFVTWWSSGSDCWEGLANSSSAVYPERVFPWGWWRVSRGLGFDAWRNIFRVCLTILPNLFYCIFGLFFFLFSLSILLLSSLCHLHLYSLFFCVYFAMCICMSMHHLMLILMIAAVPLLAPRVPK